MPVVSHWTATKAWALLELLAAATTLPVVLLTVSVTFDPTGNSSNTLSGALGKQWLAAWCTSSGGVANVMKQCLQRVSPVENNREQL
jgi:hypothetical protein